MKRTLPFPDISPLPKHGPGVYLLHFDRGFGHSRHYLGWSEDVQLRVRQHMFGKGSHLTRLAVAAGITMTLTAVWYGQDRHFERNLKRVYHNTRLCPLCKPDWLVKNARSMRRLRDRRLVESGRFTHATVEHLNAAYEGMAYQGGPAGA